MSVHAAPLNDEARWEQVLARNEAHDESFVYAVASTGIYCRPTCAGRHPRRSVVEFHSCAADAESAGFRACKRCRPGGVSPLRERMERIHRACATLQRAPETSIARLAAEGGVSARRLQREFKAMLGLSPRQYSAACRLSRFKQLVAGGENVTDAVYGAGYGSSSRLYERAGALGMTPGAYRRGAVGKTVGVTVVETDFGLILVAATAAGICAVRFGEPGTQFGTPEELIDGLRREFPEAELVSDDETLQPWAEMVARHVSGHSRVLELPLDIRGTVVPGAGVGRPATHPARSDADVRCDRSGDRPAGGAPRRRQRLPGEPRPAGDPLPSRRAGQRRVGELGARRGEEARAARPRAHAAARGLGSGPRRYHQPTLCSFPLCFQPRVPLFAMRWWCLMHSSSVNRSRSSSIQRSTATSSRGRAVQNSQRSMGVMERS